MTFIKRLTRPISVCAERDPLVSWWRRARTAVYPDAPTAERRKLEFKDSTGFVRRAEKRGRREHAGNLREYDKSRLVDEVKQKGRRPCCLLVCLAETEVKSQLRWQHMSSKSESLLISLVAQHYRSSDRFSVSLLAVYLSQHSI
jgi:hypothetical protein